MEASAEIIFGVTETPEGSFDGWLLGLSVFARGEDRDDPTPIVEDAVLCYFRDGDV